jgi:hypothetical protein
MIYEQDLQVQMQKSSQTFFIAPGKKFIIDGIDAMLHLEVTLN